MKKRYIFVGFMGALVALPLTNLIIDSSVTAPTPFLEGETATFKKASKVFQ